MCRTQHVLALILLFVGLVHSFSWDIVAGGHNKLEFYHNGEVSHVEDFGSDLDIQHLVYDAAHNRLLITDGNWTRDTFIYSFDIATKELQPLVKRRLEMIMFNESMYNLAYDPVTEILFWSETIKFTIYWFSLKPGFVDNDEYGNVLLHLDNYMPWSVAVDSCNGYIYWVTLRGGGSVRIEKARFNGTGRETVLRSNLHFAQNLVIDQQTQKMYWTQDKIRASRPGIPKKFSIQSAGFSGENRTTVYVANDRRQPQTMVVSEDSIYWVPGFELSNKVWHLPKNPSADAKPEAITASDSFINSIAVNYKIEDQLQGNEDCEPLKSLLPKDKLTNQ